MPHKIMNFACLLFTTHVQKGSVGDHFKGFTQEGLLKIHSEDCFIARNWAKWFLNCLPNSKALCIFSLLAQLYFPLINSTTNVILIPQPCSTSFFSSEIAWNSSISVELFSTVSTRTLPLYHGFIPINISTFFVCNFNPRSTAHSKCNLLHMFP